MQRDATLGLAGILLLITGVILSAVPRFFVPHEPRLLLRSPFMPWHVGPVWNWWAVLMLAGRFAVTLGVLLLLAWVIQRLALRSAPQPSSRAIEIVQERYARGELTREEYEQLLRDLRGAGQ